MNRRNFRDTNREAFEGIEVPKDKTTNKKKARTKPKIRKAYYIKFETGKWCKAGNGPLKWRVQLYTPDIEIESTKPEFDTAIELEKRGEKPDVELQFYREGLIVLRGTLEAFLRGYTVDHATRGLVFVTREQHEKALKRVEALRQKDKGPDEVDQNGPEHAGVGQKTGR